MAVSVKIDQAAAPAGVAGEAREDLVTGVAVTLAAVGGPFSQYQWVVDYRAIDFDGTGLSRATSSLTAATAATTQLAPIDKRGTYAGRLLVDSGSGLGVGAEDVAEWSFYAGVSGSASKGALASDVTSLPRRAPAAGEKRAHNVPDALDPTGNVDGWAREWLKWFSIVERLWTRQLFAVGIVSLPAGGPAALGREIGLATATRTAQGVVDVTFDAVFPDALFAAFALPIGATGGSACVTARAVGQCTVERGDPGGSLADADFILICALRI